MTNPTLVQQSLTALALTPVAGLPVPFAGIAVLRPGTPPGATGQAPQLCYAWSEIRHPDGTAQAAGELRVAAPGSHWQAAAPPPAAGAALLVTAEGLPAPGALPEPPRALSPGIDLRLLAGSGFGRESTVLAGTPCALAVVRLARMMRFEWRAEHARRVVLVAAGQVACEGRVLAAGESFELPDARTCYIDAPEASVLVLAGGG